jgi:hypothetical protein
MWVFFSVYFQGNTLLMCLYVIGGRRMCPMYENPNVLISQWFSFVTQCSALACNTSASISCATYIGVTAVERNIYHSWFKDIHSKLDNPYKLANLRTRPFFRKSMKAMCHDGSHINWLSVILIPSLMNTIFNHSNSASIVYSPAVLVLLLRS